MDTLKWVKENVGGIDVLVNNAGLFIDMELTGKQIILFVLVITKIYFGTFV